MHLSYLAFSVLKVMGFLYTSKDIYLIIEKKQILVDQYCLQYYTGVIQNR